MLDSISTVVYRHAYLFILSQELTLQTKVKVQTGGVVYCFAFMTGHSILTLYFGSHLIIFVYFHQGLTMGSNFFLSKQIFTTSLTWVCLFVTLQVVSQNVTNKSFLVCVKSEKYAFKKFWNHLLSFSGPSPPRRDQTVPTHRALSS